jgi:nicotinamide riboside kinase
MFGVNYNVVVEARKELVADDGRFLGSRNQRQEIRSDTHQFLELEDGLGITKIFQI